jgi:Ca-activated chloride channel homolog
MRRWLIAGLVACAAAARAQQPPLPPDRIRVQVDEVIVPVTVTDEKNRFISNLEARDFRITDEGREQKIRFFTRESNQPVVVGFLIDMSNQTRLHWKTYQEAAIELVLALMPGDKRFSGYLISYGNDAELQANTTSDSEKLVEKIRKMKPGGGSALYDAIYMACTNRALVKGEPYEPRRILIVIGDGRDTASKKSLEEVIEIAQRNLVTVHAMSTVAFGFNSDGEKNLSRIAEETGGRVEYPLQGLYSKVSGYLSTPSDEGNYAYKVGTGGYASEIANGIIKAVGSITGEVTTQYILRYIPDIEERSDPKQFRNIKIEIDLPNIKIRARKGYYPSNP